MTKLQLEQRLAEQRLSAGSLGPGNIATVLDRVHESGRREGILGAIITLGVISAVIGAIVGLLYLKYILGE